MSSYDEEKSAYILEKGVYKIYLGTDVRSAEICGEYEVPEDTVVEQLSQRGAPVKSFDRLVNENGTPVYKPVPLSERNLKQDILSTIPDEIKPCNKDITFADVRSGAATLDEFVGTLSDSDLEALSRGDFTMNSPLVAPRKGSSRPHMHRRPQRNTAQRDIFASAHRRKSCLHLESRPY